MSKIIFNQNSSVTYDCDFLQIGKNQVRLIIEKGLPSNSIVTSGFVLVNEYNGIVQTDRSDYIYIYRTYDDGVTVELCNDDVQYVELIESEQNETSGSFVNHELTEEEIKEMEKQMKISDINQKISSLKAQLSNSDYIFIKCYEAKLVGETIDEYDFEVLHTERQLLREQINVLETKLSELI